MIGPEPGFVRLYYYTGKQWGMKSLWEKRLKVARYEDLNDPFELIPFNLARKKSRRFYEEKVRKLLRKNRGLLCFSESWRTTLMWSHYGEKHTGMCLGFDVPDELAVRVTYVETLLDDPLDDRDEHYGMTLKVFEDALHCKYAGWSYEQERRVHFPLGPAVDGIHYKDFDATLHLREVILGPRCTVKPSEVVSAVSNPPLDVEIFSSRVAFGRFEVCKQELVSTQSVKGWRDRLRNLPDVYDDQLPPDPPLAEDDGQDDEDAGALMPWGRDE